MNSCVLDSSAVLAYLHREPGWERVLEWLEGAVVSSVNAAEIATKPVERGAPRIPETMRALGIDVADFDEAMVYRLARLCEATREKGLSLGDRACLATAQHLGLPAVTTDRGWESLKVGIEIQVVP